MEEPRKHQYRLLIDRYLNWDLVEERLTKYRYIGESFPMAFLRSQSESPPYYSHFLAWRLGVWHGEDNFQCLNEWLGHAMGLPNWSNAKCTMYPSGYEHYFSLVWELQMAEYLASQSGLEVSWTATGPDLEVRVGEDVFYVECYTYHKSYGIEQFIQDVLDQVHGSIKAKHGGNMIFKLPKPGDGLSEFLESVLSPFVDEQHCRNLLHAAEKKWPVVLPIPESATNFHMYVKGDNPLAFDIHTSVPFSTGDPDATLDVSIREAVENKRNSNKISHHRPNLLAVNFLLSSDYQLALSRKQHFGQAPPAARYGEEFDGFLFGVCGIRSLLVGHKQFVFQSDNSVLRRALADSILTE